MIEKHRRPPNVHYLWFVTEEGFLQVYQITSDQRAKVLRFLKAGLREREGRGAAILDVELDPSEREVFSIRTTFNRWASPEFRRHVEGRVTRSAAASKKLLTVPARAGAGKKKK